MSEVSSRRLILLRHAKAEHGDMADHLRPLTIAGRRQALAVGAAMAAQGIFPDVVLCSAAVRTRQTWELVRSGFGAHQLATNQPTAVLPATDPVASPQLTASVEIHDELYGAGPAAVSALLEVLEPTAMTVLVVGHEPTMSALAARLADPRSSASVLHQVRLGVPTASWSVLEFTQPWTQLTSGSAFLTGLFRS